MDKTREIAAVGVKFESRQEILAYLHPAKGREPLRAELVREPDNPYDPNAVQVRVGRGTDMAPIQVGYVPRGLAAKLAARIDAGEAIRVTGVRILRSGDGRKTTYGARVDVQFESESEEAV